MDQNSNNNKDFLEPVVLGTVKKGKTGKPLMAVIIILLIGVLIYFLPVFGNYFEGNSIIDLIKNGELINFIKNKNKPTINNNHNQNNLQNNFILINNNENIDNNNLVISNIQLKNNVLSYKIKSKNATYDASLENLYLQIYVNKETLVYTKALDEVFTINEKSVKENVSFYKDNNKYFAILKKISNNDIEEIVLSSDESGIASINCTLGNDSYEYIFLKKELVKIERVFHYVYDPLKLDEYQKAVVNYSNLKDQREKYMIETNFSEDSTGFNYTEKIDLETANISELGNNYYGYKTLAKVVKFKQEAKGFDCE